jgi:DNA-binding sugar fermentation-stimulating protein
VLFVVQDPLVEALRPSDVHDPTFASTARRVACEGVTFHAVRAVPTLAGLVLDQEVPVDLEPYAAEAVAAWKRELDATSGWKRSAPVAST